MDLLCLEFSTYIFNCYQVPARLFIVGGKEIKSNEDTTQGDPIAMGMYAISVMPLLQPLQVIMANTLNRQKK